MEREETLEREREKFSERLLTNSPFPRFPFRLFAFSLIRVFVFPLEMVSAPCLRGSSRLGDSLREAELLEKRHRNLVCFFPSRALGADCGGGQAPCCIWSTVYALFPVVFLVSETIPRALERACVSRGALQGRFLDCGHSCASGSELEEGESKKVDAI